MTITSIEGNKQKLDGGSMFGNAPRAVWEKWTPPDEKGRIDLSCRSFLIQWNNLNILIETGIGAFFEPKMAERFGVQTPDQHLLRRELRNLKIEPENIDYVILSHLHFDHAGGLLPTHKEINSGDDQIIFSKAQFIIGQEAWERAKSPHFRDKASFIPGLTQQLEATGRLNIIQKGKNFPQPLDKILEYRISNGHTPGQLLTLIKGKSHKALFTGDLIPGSHWVHLPITMGYDRFPEAVIDEKEQIYQEALQEQWILLFTHDDKIAGATVEKMDNGKITPRETFKSFKAFQLD